MRVPINLSSEPFRRDRPILIASSLCAVLLSALLGVLVFLIMNERGQASQSRIEVERVTEQLRTEQAEQARLDAVLRQPANAEVLERSVLLNSLLVRKSISWTKIFADLEAVKPYEVRIVSIRLPQINSRNEVLLDMVVGAKDPAPVIQFFKRLEESPRFGTIVGHSSTPPTQNDPLYTYRVSVNYAQKL